MKTLITYCTIVLSLTSNVLCGCSTGNDKTVDSAIAESYCLDDYTTSSPSDIFSDIEVIPLLWGAEGYYPSVATDLSVSDSIVFVRDKDEILHVFDAEGKYLACSKNRMGYGPGEYSIFMGFIPEKQNRIEILTPDRMISYDTRLNYLGQRELKTKIGEEGRIYDRGIGLGNGYYLLQPTMHSMRPHSVTYYDMANNIALHEIDYAEDVVFPFITQTKCFFRMPDGDYLFCPPAFTRYIYRVDPSGNKLSRYISMTYGGQYVNEDDVKGISEDMDAISRYYFNGSKPIPSQRMINSSMIFTMIRNGRMLKDNYLLVIDRTTGECHRIDLHNDRGYQLGMLWDIDEKYAYAINRKDFVVTNPDVLLGHSENFTNILSTLEDDVYVLIKYQLNKPTLPKCITANQPQ